MALSPLPPLACLQAFDASARYLSLTRAGRELHLSTSAVSRQISQLAMQIPMWDLRIIVRDHFGAVSPAEYDVGIFYLRNREVPGTHIRKHDSR
ncbi:LysR family transcriptional regulator [Paraburkholderia fungorum]|uniref:LysR family transcriptional regulator n=1 Tax=Paraburkholderia fungorum TaxID=134537 RepID=UPI0038BA849B